MYPVRVCPRFFFFLRHMDLFERQCIQGQSGAESNITFSGSPLKRAITAHAWVIFCFLTGPIERNWIGNAAAHTQTSAHVGYCPEGSSFSYYITVLIHNKTAIKMVSLLKYSFDHLTLCNQCLFQYIRVDLRDPTHPLLCLQVISEIFFPEFLWQLGTSTFFFVTRNFSMLLFNQCI